MSETAGKVCEKIKPTKNERFMLVKQDLVYIVRFLICFYCFSISLFVDNFIEMTFSAAFFCPLPLSSVIKCLDQ